MITMQDVNAYLTYLLNEMDKASDLDNAKTEGEREGKILGRREGKIEGRREGKREGKREVAINMIKLGINSNLIYEATGITKEEQEKLKKE